ncbi:MAG: hypothetical protein JWL62_3770 [Hyphomicrobiales bacterium]|nr:hypothetical protein [Hyphomicrobiales bacterium]
MVGKTEIRRSLKTADLAEAKRRLSLEIIKVRAEFDLAATKSVRSPSASPAVAISEQRAWALAAKWFIDAERRAEALDAGAVNEERLVDFSYLTDLEDTNTPRLVAQKTAEFLEAEGLDFPPGSVSFTRVERHREREAAD